LKTIDRIYTRLLQLMMAFAAAYIGLMMVTIVYIALCRTMGWSYSRYAFPFVEFGFLYVLAFGSPWMVRTRGHVYIELLTAAVPDAVRRVLTRIVAVLATLICAVLAYYTARITLEQYAFDTYDELRGDLNIKMWYSSWTMPLGFGLMAIEFFRFIFSREPMHTGKAGVVGEDA